MERPSAEMILWWDIRDQVLGGEVFYEDMPLERFWSPTPASQCLRGDWDGCRNSLELFTQLRPIRHIHPEADMFIRAFDSDDFHGYFLDLANSGNVAALGYAGIIKRHSLDMVEKAALNGFAYACGWAVSAHIDDLDNVSLEWAKRGALADDRISIAFLGCLPLVWPHYNKANDTAVSLTYYRRAAELGNVFSMHAYYNMLPIEQWKCPEGICWLSQKAHYYPYKFSKLVRSCLLDIVNCKPNAASILYECHERIKGYPDGGVKGLFRTVKRDHGRQEYVTQTIQGLVQSWDQVARDAAVAWVLFAKQIYFNKDVRRIISRLIWASRKNGLAAVSNEFAQDVITTLAEYKRKIEQPFDEFINKRAFLIFILDATGKRMSDCAALSGKKIHLFPNKIAFGVIKGSSSVRPSSKSDIGTRKDITIVKSPFTPSMCK